jgi:signal transduction histidine kinase
MESHSTTHFMHGGHEGGGDGISSGDGAEGGVALHRPTLVTILIAEDSLTQALALRHVLERHQFDVVTAANGSEAVARLHQRRPTIVITDINMPQMDGYELCRRVKGDAEFEDLPVILLTSLSDPRDVLKGIECGADSFVVKPYDENILVSRIEHLLANLPLRKRDGGALATEIVYDGQRYAIDTARGRSVELLISTYEVAVLQNRQLAEAKRQLESQADELGRALCAVTESHAQLQTAQLQLIEAEKLQTIAQLAAGVAHEVKNPMQILRLGIGLLADLAVSRDDSAQVILSEMKDAVERASLVVRDLTDLSAQSALEIRPACVNELVQKTLRLVKHDLTTSKITVVKELAGDLPKCQLDPNKILQVFINLIVNAAHAMPNGGMLTVKTSKKVMDADDADHQASGFSDPRYRMGDTVVDVEIRDTGTGIPVENLGNIFKPFFTTKPAGQGTGMGLVVVKQIVDLHRGMLSIRNADEGGVVVSVTFTQTHCGQ